MAERVGKYKVGDEFPNGKRLVECVGTHPKFRTKLWIWECISCGTRGGPSLTNSLTRDRGPRCCLDQSGPNGPRWSGYKEMTGVFLGQYRYDAQRKGREWSVTPEYLWSLWEQQEGKCALSGLSLRHGTDASIDRIDSSRGYVEGNVQWVHQKINRMKTDFDEHEFLSLCKSVADFSAGRL